MTREDRVLCIIRSPIPRTAQLIVCCQLFPHQWNSQNTGGKKRGKYDVHSMWLQNFIKNIYISKLVNSITHHIAMYMLIRITRVSKLGLCIVQERKDKFPFCFTHMAVKVYFCKFNSELFTLKSLLRHKSRNTLFFQEMLIAKNKLKQDRDDSESTTFTLTESYVIIHLGQSSFNISKKQYQNEKYLKKQAAAFIPKHFTVK